MEASKGSSWLAHRGTGTIIITIIIITITIITYPQSKVEASKGSSWLAHRGTGTRVALNVTANSQWKEVNHDDNYDDGDDNDNDYNAITQYH